VQTECARLDTSLYPLMRRAVKLTKPKREAIVRLAVETTRRAKWKAVKDAAARAKAVDDWTRPRPVEAVPSADFMSAARRNRQHDNRFRYLVPVEDLCEAWVQEADIGPLASMMQARGSFLPTSVVRKMQAEAGRGGSVITANDIARWRVQGILMECYQCFHVGKSYADKVVEAMQDVAAREAREAEQALKRQEYKREQAATVQRFLSRTKKYEEEAKRKADERAAALQPVATAGDLAGRRDRVDADVDSGGAARAASEVALKGHSVALVCDARSCIPKVVGNREALRRLVVPKADAVTWGSASPPQSPAAPGGGSAFGPMHVSVRAPRRAGEDESSSFNSDSSSADASDEDDLADDDS